MFRKSKIIVFRGFEEDMRTSMEVYADNLIHNLCRVMDGDMEIEQFRPRVSLTHRLFQGVGNFRMRLNRYVHFPFQVRGMNGALNHILDHGYAHLLGVLDPSRTVITVHDLIPVLASAGKIRGVKLNRRQWLSIWSARYYRKARHIIAISHNTKNDLVECCGCNPHSITVVPLGIKPDFKPVSGPEKAALRFELGLPGEHAKLVLITGQQFYKNQTTSIKVMERLQSKYGDSIRLVRLGRDSDEWNLAIRGSPLRQQIIRLEDLPADQMPRLYNAVDCLLFPSWYEGFGLPPIEAMASGVPVVTSCAASLPEVVGNAAMRARPDDVGGLADAVEALLEDRDLRNEKIRIGLLHSRQFDWMKTANMTMEVYREILETQPNLKERVPAF